MNRYINIARAVVVLMTILALLPLARWLVDWFEVTKMLDSPPLQTSSYGYDWVSWQEREGIIYAGYVLPKGPAARAGLQNGDVFLMLDYHQYFNADDLVKAIDGINPGEVHTFTVSRDSEFVNADVQFTRYPTFLYPLSNALWQFSIWGFLLGAFFHIVGLVIVGPLAVRSPKARFSLLLIMVSSIWFFSNLLRLFMVELFGPPLAVDGPYDRLFQAFTLFGLIGWIGFPALLLQKVLKDVDNLGDRPIGPISLIVYLPAIILGLCALFTTFGGSLGPITPQGLVTPILFYACCYVATAAAVVLIAYYICLSETEAYLWEWNRPGSAITIFISLLFALSLIGIVPLFGEATTSLTGWIIVGAQLLSIAPVMLVSHATLRLGKLDRILSRSIVFITFFGIIFFSFAGGFSLIDRYFEGLAGSRNAIAGVFAVFMLIVFERFARRTHNFAANLMASERQNMYRSLSRFQEQMRDIIDFNELARKSVDVVANALSARSAAVFLRAPDSKGAWISSRYHPLPPYLTEQVVNTCSPFLENKVGVWARNSELNESDLPYAQEELLKKFGVVLLVPVLDKDRLIGVLALGQKNRTRAVYNLEEIELLRSFSGNLALAIEHLKLVEREKALIRKNAEAHLVALRAQINPHFLFNALNTIIALIEEQPEEAEATVEDLACIFRYTLQTGNRPFVTLEEEFELIKHYLSIEQKRFGVSLSINIHLNSAFNKHPVPAFSVQTLVENAVKHGLAKKRGGGTLSIFCRNVSDAVIEVAVADDGVGIPSLFDQHEDSTPSQEFFGLGLQNVSSRLEQLYGRTDLLSFESTPESGTTARLLLPSEVNPPEQE